MLGEGDGLVARIRQVRRLAATVDRPGSDAREPQPDRLQALEARVAHLERCSRVCRTRCTGNRSGTRGSSPSCRPRSSPEPWTPRSRKIRATAGSDLIVSTFFIPGTGEDRGPAERAYGDMRAELEREIGTCPNPRRIAKLWARRAGTHCITEVGMPDPLRGGIVLAIFDMGQQRPFVVWWRPHGAAPTRVRESLGHHAYAVVEFDS
jgi:hypothetical protein